MTLEAPACQRERGQRRSPDLHAITQALGAAEVLRRLRALAG